MNYSGNMPDWHQYNPPQSGINGVTSTAQNVNSGHLSFISSISPTCPTQLNGLNLSSDGLEKHQNDPNFNPRHFQPAHLPSNISHGHNAADGNPLASMVQMQNCIGHYGPSNTRNPMVDNLNGPMDPRNAAIGGINEELGYRNNQVPLNGPISHLNGPNVMNMNAPHASHASHAPHAPIGPRNANVNSHAAGRSGPPPSFVPCKGLCCNPDPNINYPQWEKYCSYQNNAAYRENVRSSAGYQADARRFGGEYNFRKDNFDAGKEMLSPMVPPPNGPNADHRRNFSDFKYRKDRLLSRSYPPSSGMVQNYPVQSYNYAGEYQKYPYNVKEYSKMSGMNVPSQGMVKHPEQGFAMPQQKYNKQAPYQTGGAMMPTSVPSTSVPNPSMMPSAPQNTYYNSQYPRNLTADAAHDCQEVADNASMVNRMQTNAATMHAPSPRSYQMVQQKLAMKRFTLENHLRELARIPGYQVPGTFPHSQYKECVQKYREILKAQQPVTYQGQLQQTPCVAASTVNTSAIPPINLQFDQNGVLINSNYMPEAFPRVQQPVNTQAPINHSPVDKQGKQDVVSVPEMASRSVHKPEQLVSQQHDGHPSALCAESMQKQDQYPAQKGHDQNQFQVQKAGGSFDNLAGSASDAVIQQKMSKEFANKPELDVRQFLANWDESEDEDGAGASVLPGAVLTDSTPVVVVGYENVDLSAKTLEGLEVSKPEEIAPSVITFENQQKSVVPAQDCLTISYSAAENVEVAKDQACKDIAKEAVVPPGSHIIQCISNGPDEVPTIHIVDNLEIGSILQVTNGQVAETLETQDAVPFFQEGTEVEVAAITLEADKFKKTDAAGSAEPVAAKYNAELENLSKEAYVEGASPPKTAESTSQASRIGDQEIAVLPATAKDSARDANLKKQSSFASEESHNPDDISLPDLPTSECTPISTTLNTPIHSDNEESSERVEDLTISTNPIEIMQNSPVISFTQSPTKGEPYDHLNSEGTVRNKPADSLDGRYQAESRFKNNGGDNNMLGHDAILNTFEFSANADKNEPTTSTKSGKERANLNGISAPANNGEKPFAHDNKAETVEATSMRMTLTSGEYELKIVSMGAQNKSQVYKNLTSERGTNESQAATPDAQKISQTETRAKVALWYSDSTKDNAAQGADPDPVEFAGDQVDVNYSGKRRVSTDMTRQAAMSTAGLSPTNNTAPRSSRTEDGCATQVVNSPTSKHPGGDKLRKPETPYAKENFPSERSASGDRSARVDAKDSKGSWYAKLADRRKSISSDQPVSHKKRCLSENVTERCGETIVHHNKHTQEAAARKDKSCTVENPKGSDSGSHNKPRVIENISIVDSEERMRLLKKYRRIKYNSLREIHDKGKDTQEALDYVATKKSHRSSNPDERSASQSPCDSQKDVARLKSSEEQEGKHANILKTFVTKNMNPDFAIQVTNVNLKLKDDDHQKGQHLREEAKSSGSLDAIKIEINVSCTERNTTEKLLHENIKNAVAETIGHLTNSISNGARSNSTSLTEIQCDKADRRDYEKRASETEAFAYNEAHEDHSDAEMKLKSTCKEDANGESLVSKKRRGSLSEQEQLNDEGNGTLSNTRAEPSGCDVNLRDDAFSSNVNTESEPASSALKASRSEHASVRRRSVQQEAERKVAATSFCSEEPKDSTDNSPYQGSRSVNVQKKEHQETAVASSCRSARSFQDDPTSRLNAVPSTSSGTVEPSLEDTNYDNPVHFDYNHFDVAPNESPDAGDRRADRWKRPKRDDGRFGNFDLYGSTSGYVNPTFFSANKLENLNTVPVYTTKDGKITYSPNPRFTYRELIMEARAKDSHSREQYFVRSPSYDYHNCSKLRKTIKRIRDAGRKREIDLADAKSAAKHVDYLPNKNAAHKSVNCVKARGASHLEFFNDDADKLYATKSAQESKEGGKKNIVDLDFIEKQYNLDTEPAPGIKHCKTRVFADNLEYEKEYGESSVFSSNLFLEPRAACWEETMESIKSYSSHIDRRNTGNVKELNFSEIFVAQKRLDPFPFLPVERDPCDNVDLKANCDVTNEPTLHHATCSYIDDLQSMRDDESQREQSDAVLRNEREIGCNNQSDALADVTDKPVSALEPSPSMQSDERTEKQESRFDGDESSAIKLAERARSCSPKVADEKIHDPEGDRCSASYVDDKDASTEHLVEEDLRPRCAVSPKDDKSDAEVANTKENSEENSTKVASPSKLNDEPTETLDESKIIETLKESALTSNERDDKIDSAKHVIDDSNSAVNRETVCQQQALSDSIDHEDKKETAPATEASVSAETSSKFVTKVDSSSITQDGVANKSVCHFDQTDEQDTRDRGDSALKKDEPVASENPADVAFVEETLDQGGSEQRAARPEDDGQKAEVSLKDRGNDVVDASCPMAIPPPVVALNLRTDETVCDLFACERREQNISEFTVIKSNIKGDKKQCQESGTTEDPKDCGSIIDSKLLCMDSSDCGIYVEDRCALAQISEHDFTEDDSMVPMVWETSQIQEDAVNRLCSIDESSINFTSAVNSLQDNSLLDHLSLSRMSTPKEPRDAEVITEIEAKAIDETVPAVESAATIEESKATPNSDVNKEQNEISSSSYEKIAYLSAIDCNANTKMVPKLVIKKSETSSKFVTKVGSSSITQDGAASKSVCQPKIPKMIIRNARSRPGTPSIEAVREETSAQANILDRTTLTSEDLCESNSESLSLQEFSRNKIPKMKIKLDEKHSSKIVRADDDAEVCVKRKSVKKTVPKVKIKSTSRSDLADNSVNGMTSQESRDSGKYEEKIPILKLRKQERNRSSSPEVTRKRQSSSHSELPVKKYKRSGRDEVEHCTRRSNSSDSARTNALECETKKNPSVRISEKIPKVIIKRTSASAEFKCELSKGCESVIAKSAKWQPEVKLERYRILDSMVKDLKLTLSPVTLRAIDRISASRKDGYCRVQQGDHKLSRSNSTSDLLPARFKQRRMSDYDCRKVSDASRVDLNFAPSPDTDSKDTKTCTTPKKNASFKGHKSIDDKDNKRRPRSRNNNSRSETDVTSCDKEINQSSEKADPQKAISQCDKTDSFDINCEQAIKADEDAISNTHGQKNTLKHPSSSNFKLALKELKASSKVETCLAKLPGPSETSPEEDNLQTDKERREELDGDSFLNKSHGKVAIKKERLSFSDMDNDCTLQDDIDLLKDDSASMLDNFEIDNSTVIKVESSDESQSTIEILPASPDVNHSELERHMVEDGDTEQLYTADAIPTQFELELEITDNSNTDLLDVSMPKLDPVTYYNPHHASEESSAKLGCYNKSEASSRDRNSLGLDKRILEIDISGDGRPALDSSSVGSVREVPSRVPCCKAADFAATRENFCCNESLIKEVLAAKETLKKCLSKSRYDVQSSAIGSARSKTAAEKKQGLSLIINSLSEVPSSEVSQDRHSNVAPQRGSTPVANKHKTENISNDEKSDKKHSKQSKSSFVKKKPRSPEKNEADSRETARDTLGCNTISLRTFKQLGQVASNESPACTVHLNEKRKNLTGRSDDVPHQDPQRKEKTRMSTYKIPKISRFAEQGNKTSDTKEMKPKEDNMPILEPEVNVNCDTNPDRETSRSPPVITIQDNEDLDIAESKLVDDDVITPSIKVESNTKNVHKKSEMSIVDLITQLAYHEKATIKHRRYCNLCERWFPTTSRHRRHLAGYQHRHMELTQRRSIHALFTLFTGKLCPRLVPTNVARSDCSVGELTPLQIAVQDVTRCFDRTQQSPKKENDVDK
ncbi:PREDICTED: uncharacterized protein LOC105563123 [Vollenhovia emeryi]|uniref:uncharacterized protein LOC105563123 n=1 Tax=Vollenhovia emeryi TaxID=411798 RepID=UPI0005F45FAC|nr:PREDICTED: uncharacterized protein LOC105563123 [Vollenhovia emeryi]XP_011869837.1 PREDICTED: uncharacterized protein LOC105563123 [Vollenhovia emeryi]XP_011869838.1 PREDICTED: uncharacterized protein LOC105563123 [Vollenhovia emeryi]